ncbi:MAG: hypothetical protein M0D57_09400 [Sphingobacteriales bacterium JAD_PAG50586_3]|nr:MAG: hypothetical protein M0D57_09400 [Sphingobacteriales bacterium JAD_PAG50586_3]
MIYVFKTTVTTKAQVKKLKPLFDNRLVKSTWNFDLEDKDKILRVESPLNITRIVATELHKQGFECEELV